MSSGQALVVALLALVCFALIAIKQLDTTWAGYVRLWLSFDHLPSHLQHRVLHLLFTPMGALIVVLFRLTLGLRVLGPFRSVLLGIAFQTTGILVGVALYVTVICAVVGLRPGVKRLKMPYFGRASAMMVCVTLMVTGLLIIGEAFGVRELINAAYFPIVVLTLAGGAFGTTLKKEGAPSACWRAGSTAAAATIITLISMIPWLQQVMLRYPELMLLFLAAMIVSSKLLAFRVLQFLNPPVKKKSKRSSARPGALVPAPVPSEPAIAAPEHGVRPVPIPAESR